MVLVGFIRLFVFEFLKGWRLFVFYRRLKVIGLIGWFLGFVNLVYVGDYECEIVFGCVCGIIKCYWDGLCWCGIVYVVVWCGLV